VCLGRAQIGPRFNVVATAAKERSVTSTRFGPCSRGAPCTTFSPSAPSSSVRRLLQHPRLARGRVPPALHDEDDAGRPSPRDGDRGGGCLGARVVDAAGGGRRHRVGMGGRLAPRSPSSRRGAVTCVPSATLWPWSAIR
jgi:hypothetical protein